MAGLLAVEVPAVVATTAEVEDELAAPAVRFYKGLAGGASIASAFRATRLRCRQCTVRSPSHHGSWTRA
ncbi:MAG: hypothetical protein U0X20_17655 [Caldilineaceae bacterium]